MTKFKIGEEVLLVYKNIVGGKPFKEIGKIKLLDYESVISPTAKYIVNGWYLNSSFHFTAKDHRMHIEKTSPLFKLFYL